VFPPLDPCQTIGASVAVSVSTRRLRVRRGGLIDRFPDAIVISRYLSEVISTGRLLGQQWGYFCWVSIAATHPKNRERIANGIACS